MDSAFENVHLDKQARILRIANFNTKLSPTEIRLLAVFLESPRQILPHRYLVQKVWGTNYGEDVGLLKGVISSLRKKLASNRTLCIKTIWGWGYRLDPCL